MRLTLAAAVLLGSLSAAAAAAPLFPPGEDVLGARAEETPAIQRLRPDDMIPDADVYVPRTGRVALLGRDLPDPEYLVRRGVVTALRARIPSRADFDALSAACDDALTSSENALWSPAGSVETRSWTTDRRRVLLVYEISGDQGTLTVTPRGEDPPDADPPDPSRAPFFAR